MRDRDAWVYTNGYFRTPDFTFDKKRSRLEIKNEITFVFVTTDDRPQRLMGLHLDGVICTDRFMRGSFETNPERWHYLRQYAAERCRVPR